MRDRIYTELSVFDLVDGDVHVRETFGADMDGLRARLDMSLHG